MKSPAGHPGSLLAHLRCDGCDESVVRHLVSFTPIRVVHIEGQALHVIQLEAEKIVLPKGWCVTPSGRGLLCSHCAPALTAQSEKP